MTQKRYLNPYITIPDPIYDSIRFNRHHLRFIKNTCFQRLRSIRQLSCAYLVFPALNHTRYEHSLGVYHLTSMTLNRIVNEFSDEYFSDNRLVIPKIYEKDNDLINLIREKEEILKEKIKKPNYIFETLIAALYHDIGQSAFGHLINVFNNRNPKIEGIKNDKDQSRKLILSNPELSKIFKSYNDSLIKKKLPTINKEHIVAMITEGSHPVPELNFLGELIHSSIDLDRLDYLNRDCYYSGIINANIPYNFIISNIRIFPYVIHSVDGKDPVVLFKLCYDKSALFSIEFLLISRYFMYNQIYHDPIEKIAENMIVKAIEININDGTLEYEKLFTYTDEELLTLLKKNEKTRKTISNLTNGNFYYLVESRRYPQLNEIEKNKIRNLGFGSIRLEFLKEWEKNLAESLGIDEKDVIIDLPKTTYYDSKISLWDEESKSITEFSEHTSFKNIFPNSINYILCAISEKKKILEAKKKLFEVIK